MSMASIHPAELSSSLDHLGSRSMSAVSLDNVDTYGMYYGGDSDLSGCGDEGVNGYPDSHETAEAVLSIEELRAQLSSCFTCGVNWSQQHVSLDCSECGGYALDRPCPLCRAACGQRWKRDLNVSHTCGKARWQGVCPFSEKPGALQAYPACGPPPTRIARLPSPCSAAARLASDLCQRLEQLSAQQRQS